jgi:hypothetical protein
MSLPSILQSAMLTRPRDATPDAFAAFAAAYASRNGELLKAAKFEPM